MKAPDPIQRTYRPGITARYAAAFAFCAAWSSAGWGGLIASPVATDVDGVRYEIVEESAGSAELGEEPGRDLISDTVILKSGKVFTNVKTFPRGGTHTIKFQNGRAISVPNAKIKIVRIKGVSWKARVQKRQVAVAAVARKRQPSRAAAQQVPVRRPPPRRVVIPRQPIGRELQALREDQKRDPEKESKKRFALGPVTKSILLPGWGQYSLGHNWRAGAVAALGIPIVSYYSIYRAQFNTAQANYSEIWTPTLLAQPEYAPTGYPLYYAILTGRRQILLEKEAQTNSMVFALMSLWALQAVDTYYLNAKNGGKDPFYRYARKIGFTDPGSSRTTLLAFSDGRNFIFGMGVRF